MITKTEIKERFLVWATGHGMAISIGDHKKANKIHKELQVLYNLAKEHNLTEVFSEFLDDTNENVCLWASTFTLKVFPALAEKSLKRLSRLSTITGLSAETTLQLWRRGLLNLL